MLRFFWSSSDNLIIIKNKHTQFQDPSSINFLDILLTRFHYVRQKRDITLELQVWQPQNNIGHFSFHPDSKNKIPWSYIYGKSVEQTNGDIQQNTSYLYLETAYSPGLKFQHRNVSKGYRCPHLKNLKANC